jgi:hypothetical protein
MEKDQLFYYVDKYANKRKQTPLVRVRTVNENSSVVVVDQKKKTTKTVAWKDLDKLLYDTQAEAEDYLKANKLFK